MNKQRTLSIIKPNAVKKKIIGEIYRRFEKAGLKIIAAKMKYLSKLEAENFYAIHKDKAFFNTLIKFMTSGPVMIQVLEDEDAIMKNRKLIGATDPKKAKPGTIRADFANNINENTVHGSDTEDIAEKEIKYFFSDTEIFS